jgi:hypothetical protein
LHHGVEFVPVDDQNAFARGGDVNRSLLDIDIAVCATEVAHQLVVISRDVDHMGAFARLAQKFLDHVVVLLWPVDSATQRPDVDQVAYDVERVEIVLAKEIE